MAAKLRPLSRAEPQKRKAPKVTGAEPSVKPGHSVRKFFVTAPTNLSRRRLVIVLLGLRASEAPQPETQAAQDHEGHGTWPQWQQMPSHQNLRTYV
jgi:hypothetical protein